jgi:hypothetical protein
MVNPIQSGKRRQPRGSEKRPQQRRRIIVLAIVNQPGREAGISHQRVTAELDILVGMVGSATNGVV